MLSATTQDSRSVTFSYDVPAAGAAGPLEFQVYRSPDGRLDGGDVPVGGPVIVTPGQSDLEGAPATGPGVHRYRSDAALPIDPGRPYVVVAAADGPINEMSFRTHVIGVVAHGFGLSGQFPPWVDRAAASLRARGTTRPSLTTGPC
jgi:hypothetical protein